MLMFFPTNLRILLYTAVTDMRKSIDGLCYLVSEKLEENPALGTIFVFCNRPRDKLKLLYWDGNGFCLLYKRLEKGRFKMPSKGQNLRLKEGELRALLTGIDWQNLEQTPTLAYSIYR